jgi:hypothetical protein
MPPTPPNTFYGPRKGANGARAAILSAEAWAIQRDQLLTELAGLGSQDLDTWPLHAWPKANTLAPEDGGTIRLAFQARLAELRAIPSLDLSQPDPLPANAHSRIDKSVLALPEAKRLRDKQHLRFVAKQPCLVCGREPCDPHYLRFAQSRGVGLKVSDEFAVPLCRAHHRELHRAGKEVDWWSRSNIEPIATARRLWIETHSLMISRSFPGADNAALETELPINEAETTAVPQQRQQMERAKRTQSPGTPL